MGLNDSWELVGVRSSVQAAARAAARAEGLSVGEWLTDLILGTATDRDGRDSGQSLFANQIAQLAHRLQALEEEVESDTSRKAIKSLHQDLSRLTADFLQATGQSTVQISKLAADVEGFDTNLHNVRMFAAEALESVQQRIDAMAGETAAKVSAHAGEIAKFARTLEDTRAGTSAAASALDLRLGELAERADKRHADLAGRVDGLGADLCAARADTAARFATVEQSLERIDDRAVSRSAVLENRLMQLGGQLDDVRGMAADARAEFARRLDLVSGEADARASAVESRFGQIAKETEETHAELRDGLKNLGGRLDTALADVRASNEAVDRRLDGIADAAGSAASNFEGRLQTVRQGLDGVLAEVQSANAALDARIARVETRSEAQNAAMAVEVEHLKSALRGIHGDASETLKTNAERFGELERTLSGVDARHGDTARVLTETVGELGRKVDAAQAQSAETAGRFAQQLAELQQGVGELDARHRDDARAMEGRVGELRGQIEELQTGAARVSEELDGRVTRLQERLANRDALYGDVSRSLAGKLESLQARVETVATEAAGQSGRIRQDLQQATDHSATLIAALAGKVGDLSAGFDGASAKSAAEFAAIAQFRTEVQNSLRDLESRHAAILKMLEELPRREAEVAGTIARIERTVEQLEAKSAANPVHERIAGIERSIQALESRERDAAKAHEEAAEAQASREEISPAISQGPEGATATAEILKPVCEMDLPPVVVEDGLPPKAEFAGAEAPAALAEVMPPIAEVLLPPVVADAVPQPDAQSGGVAAATADELPANADTSLPPVVEDTADRETGESAADAHVEAVETDGEARAEPAVESTLPADAPKPQRPDHLPEHGEMEAAALPSPAAMGFEPPAFVLKSPVSDLRDMPAAARFEAWGPAELAMAEPQFAAASQEASDVPDGESVHDPVQHNEDPGSEAAADSAGADGEHPAEDAGAEASDGEGRPISFLASARRSAQAASELRDTKSRGQGKFGISMLMGSGPNAEDRIKRASIALLAATVLLAVVALGANLFLGQSSVVPRAIADSRPRGTAVASADAGIRRSATVSEGQAAAQAAPQPPMATPLDKTASLANAGDARAQLVIGLKYLGDDHTAPRYAEAAKWLGLAAKQGEPLAAYRLGTLYAAGHGVPADAAQAIRWYRAAADAGNRKAMYNLAVAYILGNGVTKNLPEAVRWLSKAANHGLVDAQFDLAVLYERGQGVPQSLLDAYHWYGIAARQGDAESKKRIVALATQISADDRAAAETAIAQFHAAPLNQAANAVP